jgi:hypothetical protein
VVVDAKSAEAVGVQEGALENNTYGTYREMHDFLHAEHITQFRALLAKAPDMPEPMRLLRLIAAENERYLSLELEYDEESGARGPPFHDS